MPKLRHGSLFSGIGGFDLAAEWMGWENVFHCEWNDFGKKILKYYWPDSISYDDITKTDFFVHRGQIDILTGGFPCQPYSMAGKRKGKEDERHLWPEMLRAIREIQPRWIVGENVYGLVNWSGGLVFDEIHADLEAQGYECQAYVLPAVSVGAPHRRDRIWFVAYSTSNRKAQDRCSNTNERRRETFVLSENKRWEGETIQPIGLCNLYGITPHASDIRCNAKRPQQSLSRNSTNGTKTNAADPDGIRLEQCQDRGEMAGGQKEMGGQRSESTDASETNGKISNVADADMSRCGQSNKENEGRTSKQSDFDCIQSNVINSECIRWNEKSNENGIFKKTQQKECRKKQFSRTNCAQSWWRNFPSVSPICDGNDGISDRLDNITFSKWRQESIKGGGNAVVPQVVYQIFKTIDEYDRSTDPAALDP